MPDIGVGPPPPPDVAGQMRPSQSVSDNGGPDLGALIAQLTGGRPQQQGPDITPQVLDVQPLLAQIARMVPAIGPDVDRLNVELKAHMAGLPNALAQPGAGPGGPAPDASGPMGPPVPAAAPQGAVPTPAAPPAPPALGGMGAMDVAMQLEMKLPAIGRSDPTLMPYIQGFVARLRAEVPKVVQGETEPISPPPQPAPTEAMLSKIPVSY